MTNCLKNTETYGLTQLASLVKNINRTLAFYKEVFNAQIMYKEIPWAQIREPELLSEMINRVRKAGGRIKDQG
jgi:hypothetical protein